jgi:catalase
MAFDPSGILTLANPLALKTLNVNGLSQLKLKSAAQLTANLKSYISSDSWTKLQQGEFVKYQIDVQKKERRRRASGTWHYHLSVIQKV